MPKALTRLGPRREKVSNENIMFALATLEQRLDGIESRLSRASQEKNPDQN